MFNFFKKKELPTLKDQVVTTKVILVPVKKPHYHEIVPKQNGLFTIRIYKRNEDIVSETEVSSLEEAIEQSRFLLDKYNGV